MQECSDQLITDSVPPSTYHLIHVAHTNVWDRVTFDLIQSTQYVCTLHAQSTDKKFYMELPHKNRTKIEPQYKTHTRRQNTCAVFQYNIS